MGELLQRARNPGRRWSILSFVWLVTSAGGVGPLDVDVVHRRCVERGFPTARADLMLRVAVSVLSIDAVGSPLRHATMPRRCPRVTQIRDELVNGSSCFRRGFDCAEMRSAVTSAAEER